MEIGDENQNIALVTGCSTGIGFETALTLARNGYKTYATMRDTSRGYPLKRIIDKEGLPIQIIELDVNYAKSVRQTVQHVIAENDRINILVNNAGYGLFGALEDITMKQIKRQFETNFFGAIRTIKQVLPTMRKQRSGIIINITSIAGLVGIPGESIYSSSKFALEGLSESISYELQPYGIKVVLIEPGVISTNFVPNICYPEITKPKLPRGEAQLGSATQQLEHNKERVYGNTSFTSHYSKTVDSFLAPYYSAMAHAPSPSLVSRVVIESINKVISSPNSQCFFRYTVGEDSKSLGSARKYMSDSQFHEYVSKRMLENAD
jgi:NAD(P)-dependent dehydrogenase (short-subunit alcohol dehydrogenase family)